MTDSQADINSTKHFVPKEEFKRELTAAFPQQSLQYLLYC
jgi:hypothetical protein